MFANDCQMLDKIVGPPHDKLTGRVELYTVSMVISLPETLVKTLAKKSGQNPGQNPMILPIITHFERSPPAQKHQENTKHTKTLKKPLRWSLKSIKQLHF